MKGWKTGAQLQAERQGVAEGPRWAVRLAQVAGPNRYGRAYRLVQPYIADGTLGRVWQEDDGAVTSLYVGQFPGPDAVLAQQTLSHVQGVENAAGVRPFAEATLVAVDRTSIYAGDFPTDPLDLRRHIGQYSLAIAFYTADPDGEHRGAAEQAARDLRSEGHDAFFYHGPTQSFVTVGVFGERDFVYPQGVRAYGPRIRELQAEFPHMAGNGRALETRLRGRDIGRQPSTLVRVR